MNMLTMENVSYRYEDSSKNVLQNVSIDFAPGKVYVIMGKSGAGKSTILSLISGLDTCTEGVIQYEEKDLSKMNRDDYRAKNIGVIFQGYNLLINATALENIVLSMHISGVKEGDKKKTALALLQKVGIDAETAKRKILKLSGGEQQRVGIARAIAHDPNVIIADEPTGNLDSDTEENIMRILQDLAHNEHKCVIVVTHSKHVADRYADDKIRKIQKFWQRGLLVTLRNDVRCSVRREKLCLYTQQERSPGCAVYPCGRCSTTTAGAFWCPASYPRAAVGCIPSRM